MEVQHIIVKTRKLSSQDVNERKNRTERMVAKTQLARRNTMQRVKASCLQLVNELMNGPDHSTFLPYNNYVAKGAAIPVLKAIEMPPKKRVATRSLSRTRASKKPTADRPPVPAVEQVPAAVDATADAIAAAVMQRLEQSGRLLPAPNDPMQPAPSTSLSAVDTMSDTDGPDTIISDLLGGELSAPPSTYNVVNRPLGANLSDTLKNRIRRGDYVNLQHLLTDDGDFDEQQHQRMTLEVRSIGQEETLSVVKPNHTKEITTTGQWLSAFTIYAAVLTEHSPQHAPGLFKHIADITEMARRFGGLAWKKYDESFRKEMKANGLHFGQVHWDARFRCLEQTVNSKAVGYSFRGQVNRSRGGSVRSPAISNQLFQKGQCFQFEQFGSCTKSACHFKHACSKCFGKHPTSRCGLRPSHPQRGGRPIAPRAPNTNKL
ncbi:hypothetical protein LSAT2_030536 [Lamellibrachia satsuma]|nr:hypothetical protein LSAT2_030536 [Lamellibrachia satsuma]